MVASIGVFSAFGFPITKRLKSNIRVVCWDSYSFQQNEGSNPVVSEPFLPTGDQDRKGGFAPLQKWAAVVRKAG
jgi:hypothetical protein